MKIRMLEQRTGPRYDGREWPGYGGEIDVPDEEGAGLCAQGAAVPVAEERAETPEAKLAATEETRHARTATARAATAKKQGPA